MLCMALICSLYHVCTICVPFVCHVCTLCAPFVCHVCTMCVLYVLCTQCEPALCRYTMCVVHYKYVHHVSAICTPCGCVRSSYYLCNSLSYVYNILSSSPHSHLFLILFVWSVFFYVYCSALSVHHVCVCTLCMLSVFYFFCYRCMVFVCVSVKDALCVGYILRAVNSIMLSLSCG